MAIKQRINASGSFVLDQNQTTLQSAGADFLFDTTAGDIVYTIPQSADLISMGGGIFFTFRGQVTGGNKVTLIGDIDGETFLDVVSGKAFMLNIVGEGYRSNIYNPSGNPVDVFSKLSSQVSDYILSDEEDVIGNNYIVLQPGDYTFDLDFSYAPGASGSQGSVSVELRTNTNTSLTGVDSSDVVLRSVGYFLDNTNNQVILSCHIMTRKISTTVPIIIKSAFVDASGGGAGVNQIFLRAIKVS